MNQNTYIEAKIEQAFRALPWRGFISVEEAIADAKCYRLNLNEEERALYDQQIEAGRHPTAVLETIEIFSGRSKPSGSEWAKSLEEAKSA